MCIELTCDGVLENLEVRSWKLPFVRETFGLGWMVVFNVSLVRCTLADRGSLNWRAHYNGDK